jgi:hypothetical protein
MIGAGGDGAATKEPLGIFIFVQDTAEKSVSYDDEFRKYATLEYIEKDREGAVVSTGEFGACDADTYKEFYKLPALSVVEFDNIFCPPIDIASKIQ